MSTQLYNKILFPTVQHGGPTVQVVTVTPEMALEWITRYQFEQQRKLRQWHVEFLASEIKKGRFLQGTQIRFSIGEDGPKIIDGQHRLHAVIKSQTPQVFTILYMPEDPAKGYYHVDNNLGRSVQDMYSAIQLVEETGIGKDRLNRVGYAIKFIHGGFLRAQDRSGKLALDDLANLIREYSDAASNFFETVAGYPQEMNTGLLRVATLSLALVTFRYATLSMGVQKVEDFWTGTALDNGLLVGDPRKTANRHVLTTNMPSGQRTGLKSNIVTASYSSRYLANCWNAWVEGRNITTTRVFDDKSKINILGTPFNGK